MVAPIWGPIKISLRYGKIILSMARLLLLETTPNGLRWSRALKPCYPRLFFYSAIHPQACIAGDVETGEGSVAVNSASRIGRFFVLNTRSSLDHDCSMSNFSSLAPGVCCGGNCQIEQFSAINKVRC